jgi:cardiolipin synthase
MVAVLQSAALRGVNITIILPEKSNLRFVDWATRNLLWELLQYDIHILLQPKPFAHSKLLIVDGYYAQIGSANLDPRSLRLNFEFNMEVIGKELLKDLKEYVGLIRQKSRVVSLEEVDGRPFITRLRDACCWFFLPYL